MVYVIGAVLILLGICRMLFPNIVSIEMVHLDIYGASIFILGVGFIFYKKIIAILKTRITKIYISSQILKSIIIAVCLLIISLRLFNSTFTFDNISLYLIIAIFVVLLIPDLKDFILKVRKFKKGDLEIEFADLLIEGRQNHQENADNTNSAETSNQQDQFDTFFASLSPYTARPYIFLPLILVEVEKKVNKLALNEGLENVASITGTLNYLVENQVIEYGLVKKILRFIQNSHTYLQASDENYDLKKIADIANSGLELLKKLPEI